MSSSEEVQTIETKLQEVNIESKENAKPEENLNTQALEENDKTKNSKSKEKKKKKKKTAVEKKDANEEEDVSNKENDENEPIVENGPVCSLCKKPDPKKRCSKRHPKCLAKMFCNETCESIAHEDRKATVAKKEANKVAAAKKKAGTKIKNWKNTDSGQFWWHDQ